MGKYSKGDKVVIQNKGMYDHQSGSRVGNNGGSKEATVTKIFDHGIRTNKGYYGFKNGISKKTSNHDTRKYT